MSRFWRRRSGGQDDWAISEKSSISTAPDRRGRFEPDPRTRVTAAERLSQGSFVRASVLARLLGIRLLRLEADIILVPARVEESGPADLAGRVVSGQAPVNDARGLRDAQQLLRRAARTLEEPPFGGAGRSS